MAVVVLDGEGEEGDGEGVVGVVFRRLPNGYGFGSLLFSFISTFVIWLGDIVICFLFFCSCDDGREKQ